MYVSVDQAISLLKSGHVVGIPTETVYGLAASIGSPEAVQKIFSLKGRPANNPLITHIASAEELRLFSGTLPPGAIPLAEAFWPGPMTLVIPIDEARLSPMIRAGLPTAAFRVPQHPLTREVISRTGPLVMPSANLSGRPSATEAAHVAADFGEQLPVLDGGRCESGIESTILLYSEGRWVVARLGAIPPEAFTSIIGYLPEIAISRGGDKPLCPGQLYRHYAPGARLHLCTRVPEEAHTVIGYAECAYPQTAHLYVLGSRKDPAAVAENLYRLLRRLDEDAVKEAWVDMDIPQGGMWTTIRDRLTRAAQ